MLVLALIENVPGIDMPALWASNPFFQHKFYKYAGPNRPLGECSAMQC